MTDYDILSGLGINPKGPYPALEKMCDELKAVDVVKTDRVYETVEKAARTATEQRIAERVAQQAEGFIIGNGGIGGPVCSPDPALPNPLRGFAMLHAPHGGWVVLRHPHADPIAAFSSFDEAVTWLKRRVA